MKKRVMNYISLIGILAAILTTGSFIPQAYKVIKTRSTDDLSAVTFTMLFTGTLCWFIYGFIITDYPLILANGITAVLTGIILYMKIRASQGKKRRSNF